MENVMVLDIYSGDDIEGDDCISGFRKAFNFGIRGVIHKASQGAAFRDKAYTRRRNACADLGILWGAYHFADGSAVDLQIKNFLEAADADENTLMVLDYEDNKNSSMSISQAIQFMKGIEKETGRTCAIYSGNRLKETIGFLNTADLEYMTSRKLWLAQYGAKCSLPKGFSKYFLWQYTADGEGEKPHGIPGINDGKIADLNRYDGEYIDLIKDWIS